MASGWSSPPQQGEPVSQYKQVQRSAGDAETVRHRLPDGVEVQMFVWGRDSQSHTGRGTRRRGCWLVVQGATATVAMGAGQRWTAAAALEENAEQPTATLRLPALHYRPEKPLDPLHVPTLLDMLQS